MSVQYAPSKLRVPPGFQNLLEGLARECLREQPEDIIKFAAKYFDEQLAIRGGRSIPNRMVKVFFSFECHLSYQYVNVTGQKTRADHRGKYSNDTLNFSLFNL